MSDPVLPPPRSAPARAERARPFLLPELCKGCGRTFDEVQFWPAMGPAEKRAVWRRITLEHSAWRFNRYAERAAEGVSKAPAPAGAA